MEVIDQQQEEILLDTQDSEPVLDLPDSDINIIGMDALCRLCANTSDRLIPIYSEEGTSNDLANKMNLYLPVKVSENDNLPLQCCWHCATTVLAWHELIVSCVEADRRLRALENETEMQIIVQEDIKEDPLEERPSESTAASLSAFCPEPHNDATPRRRNRNATKKTASETAASEAKSQTWSKHTAASMEDPLDTYIDIRGPFIADCDLIDSDSETKTVYDDEIDNEAAVEDDDSKGCDDFTSQLIKFSKKQRRKGPKREPIETNEDGDADEEEEKALSDLMSLSCASCDFVTLGEPHLLQHMREAHADLVLSFKRANAQKPKRGKAASAATAADTLSKKERRKNTKLDQDAVSAAKITVDGRVYYHCHICGKNLHSPYTYIWHNRIHTGERPFVCDLCGKQFRVSQGLVRHLRETHQGVKNFPCDICGRMFATRRNVEEHRRIHTNERPYICDLCGKSFKQKASLFVHNRSHNDSFPFKCTYCNQGFRTRPPLLVHVTRHTGEKPYPCDVCGRCFRIKYELKRHRLIHSDEKPFSCLDCGISFRQKRYLRNHNKVNHNLIS